MLKRLFVSVSAGVLVLCSRDIYRLVRSYIRSLYSPLRQLRGPKSHGPLGNLKELLEDAPTTVYEKWVEEYGLVFKFRSLLNISSLYVIDPRAAAHVLAHHVDYPTPPEALESISKVLGDGLLVVQGEQHRRERRIMSPAFGPTQMRDLHSIFREKASQLRDIWIQHIKSDEATKNPDGSASAQIEVTQWLNKMTLDVIGLAGFNSSFNALNPNDAPNELNQALRTMMAAGRNPSLLDYLHFLLPFTRFIDSEADRSIRRAREVMDRVGGELIAEAKASVGAAKGAGSVSREDFQAKDVLSLLIRANIAEDMPANSRMTDEEVLAQLPTLIFAGHETTSTALSCAFYALVCNPSIQEKLREEFLAEAEGEGISSDTLNKLPYLDAFIRETLRLYPPAVMMARAAKKDDLIPTEREWVDKNGVKRTGIPVVVNDSIVIPILAMNRSKEIWGEDAYDFKPERWANLPPSVSSISGVWGASLAFSGGSRACIGYRFALAEMKFTLYVLLRSLRFSLAVDPADIEIAISSMTRPVMRGKAKEGPNLPLRISLLEDGH